MKPEKSIVESLCIADQLLQRIAGEGLSTLEKLVLEETLGNESYKSMAVSSSYADKTLKDVGSRLWKKLSLALEQPIKKSNVKARLESYQRSLHALSNQSTTGQATPISRQVDWADAPETSVFFGRENELDTLQKWVIQDRCRLVSIVGIGGVGKTGMTIRLGQGGIGKTDLSLQLAQGIQNEFDYVIWRSLLNAPPLENLLCDLIQFLSDHQVSDLSPLLDTNLRLLLKYLNQYRCLIILDNFESVFKESKHYNSSDSLRQSDQYRPGYAGYGQLLQKVGQTSHESCLILTSRERPRRLQSISDQQGKIRFFQMYGLAEDAAKCMFQKHRNLPKSDALLTQIIHFYEGNPLALSLVRQRIERVFDGDISNFLTQDNFFFEDINDLLGWHFERLSSAETEVLYWLAIGREPTSVDSLKANCVDLTLREAVPDVLDSLQLRLPINRSIFGFSLQPVIIEYLTSKLIKIICQEIVTVDLHLFHSLCLQNATTKDYIRKAQNRLILTSLSQRLRQTISRPSDLTRHLNQLLLHIKQTPHLQTGYAPANLITLFCALDIELAGYDFSALTIKHAFLQGIELQNIDLSDSDLSTAVFTQSFGGVHSVAFSPDGQYLAFGDSKGKIQLLCQENYHQVGLLEGHLKTLWVTSLSFSSVSPLLASSSFDTTVRLWDTQTGQCLHILQGHTHWIWAVAVSPDGKLVASGSDDGTIRIWVVETGECLHVLEGHSNWVWAIAFSPDGKTVASGSYDHTIRLWKVETGDCVHIVKGHENSVWAIAYSPNGQYIVSGSLDHTIKLWDTQSLICIRTLTGHTKEVRAVTFSPDGRFIISGSFDGTVKRWDITTGRCVSTYYGHQVGIRTVAISPDGHKVASGDHGQSLKIWDLDTGKCLRSFKGYINWVWSLNVRPKTPTSNSQMLATGGLDGSLYLWDIETGSCIQTLEGHNNWIWQVSFSPNGDVLASCSDDESIRVWDVASGKCLMTLEGHTNGGVWAIDFSPNGNCLASGGQDGAIRFWSPTTAHCEKVINAHNNWIWAILFNDEGSQLASCSDDRTIKIWDYETYELRYSIETGSKVTALDWWCDHSLLASGHNDGTIQLWNSRNGQLIKVFKGTSGLGFDSQVLH